MRLRCITPKQTVAIAAALLVAPALFGATFYTQDFDSGSGISTGALAGQDSWVDADGIGTVQNSTVSAGDQAVQIDGRAAGARISRAVAPGTDLVWTDYMAQVVPTTLEPAVETDMTTAFYVNGSNKVVVLDGAAFTELSATNVTPGTWTQFTVGSDYTSKTWSLWVDGLNVASDLAFHDATATGLTELGFDNGSTTTDGYLDELSVEAIASQSPADATLDFTETFESYGLGQLAGQSDWTVSPADAAEVQPTDVYDGNRAATVENTAGAGSSSTLMQTFAGTAGTNVTYSDFYAKPPASHTNIAVDASATSAFFVESANRYLVVYDGTTQTVLSGKPAVPSGAWVRFTVKTDYTTHKWSLWMNETLMAENLDFYNTGVNQLNAIVFEQGGSGSTPLDNIQVRTGSPFGGTVFRFK